MSVRIEVSVELVCTVASILTGINVDVDPEVNSAKDAYEAAATASEKAAEHMFQCQKDFDAIRKKVLIREIKTVMGIPNDMPLSGQSVGGVVTSEVAVQMADEFLKAAAKTAAETAADEAAVAIASREDTRPPHHRPDFEAR